MNIKHSKSGDNETEISCPNCNYIQADSEECLNCGIIFKKYRKPSDNFERVYRVKRSVLIFWNLLMICSFLSGGFFFITKNYCPGGIEIACFVTIISIIWGIVFLCISLSDRKFFILLTDKGLKIGKQPFIRWENIYRADWHSEIYRAPVTAYIPIKSSWIDIFYYNAKETRACKVIVTHKIENTYSLYSEIEKRMHESDTHVYVRMINKREYVEFGIWLIALLSGFLYLTLITESEEFEFVFVSNFISDYPIHAIVVGVLFFGIGALLAMRWRE